MYCTSSILSVNKCMLIFTYQQNDGVAMGSPLGPVLSGIFMVELENSLVPTLNESMTLWQVLLTTR